MQASASGGQIFSMETILCCTLKHAAQEHCGMNAGVIHLCRPNTCLIIVGAVFVSFPPTSSSIEHTCTAQAGVCGMQRTFGLWKCSTSTGIEINLHLNFETRG